MFATYCSLRLIQRISPCLSTMNETCFQNIRCLVREPKDFDPLKKYPVLLYLHGAGTRGNDINKLYTNPFFQLIETHHDLPFVIVAPLCEENTWFDIWKHLKLFVNEIAALPFADRERIYVIGASMGGYATWQLAMSMPDQFAAIVPICGGGMYWNAARLVNVPVWAFHGAKDPTVRLEESLKMVEAVKRCGGEAKLTVYPENSHDAWSDTYRNPEVFAWLLKHKKKSDNKRCDDYNNSEKYG